jgi:hypothetical protein
MLAAFSKGLHPGINHVEFFEAVEANRHIRQRQNEESRLKAITVCRNYKLEREWESPVQMMGEEGINLPAWMGHRPRVEKWIRNGAFPVFAFVSPETSSHQTSAYELRPNGSWSRLL